MNLDVAVVFLCTKVIMLIIYDDNSYPLNVRPPLGLPVLVFPEKEAKGVSSASEETIRYPCLDEADPVGLRA